ncbi:MAG: tRNA (N6-threonylcarbamoyladenosine(37)-N6)-methyltransferase TrmO [Halobacteria archaeon]
MNAGKIEFIGEVDKCDQDYSQVKIYEKFCRGIKGIESFSHLIVLYWFHLRDSDEHRSTLLVTPRKHKGAPEMGVFGTRSPSRPNPIGLCVVELIKVQNCILRVKGLDAVQGTPVIDIKPYLPRADSVPSAKIPKWALQGPLT